MGGRPADEFDIKRLDVTRERRAKTCFFRKYMGFVEDMCIYDGAGIAQGFFQYSSRGLAEEVGELQGHIAKSWRDDKITGRRSRSGFLTEREESIKKELGDVFFMWVACCLDLGFEPEEIICMNVSKLGDRRRRNKINGDGDNR